MEVFTLKVILLVAMIAFTIVAGMFPVRLLKLLRKRAALAATPGKASVMSLTLCLLTCFSGGVFLGTCFMHLFPELLEHLEKMKQSYSYDLHYPVAELLSCLGFFLLFFLEELVLKLIPSLGHGHSHGTGNVELACEHSQMEHRHAHDHHKMYHQQTSPTEDHSDKLLLNSATSATDNGPTSSRNCASNTDCIERRHSHRRSHSYSSKYGSISNVSEHSSCSGSYGIALAEPERCETDCEKVDEHPPILMKSRPHAHSHGVRSITFVLAISIHSVIEGLAFGVQSETGEVAALFISLMVHKVIVAFSVGLQLARTHAHSLGWVAASICLLAIMTPIGAMCGMLVQGASIDSEAKDMIVLIFQGMAVGTFLYVTFFEVLLHERDNEHPNMLKLAMMLLGFALIALVRFVDNGHSHGPLGGSGNGTHVHDHDGHDHDH